MMNHQQRKGNEMANSIWNEYLDHCSFMKAIGITPMDWISFRLMLAELTIKGK
jgi:hypothetical protein